MNVSSFFIGVYQSLGCNFIFCFEKMAQSMQNAEGQSQGSVVMFVR